jgi:glycosyltransferase involved in cell wall biosynthesis
VRSRPISIVCPVYDEAEALDTLVRAIREVATAHDLDIEVLFVDDGSRDQSWAKIVSLSESDPRIAGIRFRNNAGKAAALTCGFRAARGELIFMMDADLQDPPEEIPSFLEKLDEGYDVVTGWKRTRHDPWHKVYPSRVFNKLIGLLTGVRLHDHVCGFKCMRREVARSLKLYGEFHRFVCVLSAARGARVTEIPTLHRPRTTGVGKYGISRFAKGLIDLFSVCFLTRYRHRPQHPLGVTGLAVIGLALVSILLAAVPWGLLAWPAWLLTSLMTMLVPGLLLIGMGLLAVLVIDSRPASELYEESERVGWCAHSDLVEVPGSTA